MRVSRLLCRLSHECRRERVVLVISCAGSCPGMTKRQLQYRFKKYLNVSAASAPGWAAAYCSSIVVEGEVY